MLQSDRSHLEEWATLLDEDVSDELLAEVSESWPIVEDSRSIGSDDTV